VLVAGDGLGCAPLHLEDAAQVVVRHAQPLRLLLGRHLQLAEEIRCELASVRVTTDDHHGEI